MNEIHVYQALGYSEHTCYEYQLIVGFGLSIRFIHNENILEYFRTFLLKLLFLLT